jgi:hypothetical protein
MHGAEERERSMRASRREHRWPPLRSPNRFT